jgi:hypothetical protein
VLHASRSEQSIEQLACISEADAIARFHVFDGSRRVIGRSRHPAIDANDERVHGASRLRGTAGHFSLRPAMEA